MKPFWIVFKYKDGHFEIWKEYDDTKIWDAPNYEIVDYFPKYKEAQTCVKASKEEKL